LIKTIKPLSLSDLPVGSKLRLQAEAIGTQPPKTPGWDWSVLHENSGQKIATIRVDMDPATVEFPLASPGTYQITATATAVANCTKTVFATATDHPVAHLWLRFIPRNSDDQPFEGFMVDVEAGMPAGGRDVTLGLGALVSIDPRDAADTQRALFSYVRITSDQSTLRVEGHTRSGPLSTRLNPNMAYDVLVIPDGVVAPLVFRGSPGEIAQNPFTLDPGIQVNGLVSSSKGPLSGARVVLQDGIVPSTTGVAQASGQYDLRVRGGDRFAAVVIPPAHSGLPEARLPPGSGLAIYDFPAGPRVLDFSWDTINTTNLDLTVTDSAGAPVNAAVRVRLASADNAFPRVGTLTLKVQSPSQPEQRFDYHPAGYVQEDGLSDARGAISFTNVPRGMYTATLTPVDGSAAITTVPIDLTGPGRVTLSPRLARKIALSGKLQPARVTAGATVQALDPDADPALPSPTSVVDGAGGYLLHLDPGRSYSLVVQAQPSTGLPRTFLPPIVAPTKDTVQDNITVASGLSVSGQVTGAGGPVAGALVQAYCLGLPPSCLDLSTHDTTNVVPIAEAVSDDGGAYRLLVPDPATPN
jgi:hypothetical protein